MEFQKVVAEISFNYPEDAEEFKDSDRIIRLNRFTSEEGQNVVAITFNLGRKEDDSISLVLPYAELIEKLDTLETER